MRGTRAFAERLRERVRESSFGPPDAEVAITISVGVAVAEGKGQLEPDKLLAEADQALYDAKSSGRNRVAMGSKGATAS
jgi:diguanylate cyclase (GGDEF)-like protein